MSDLLLLAVQTQELIIFIVFIVCLLRYKNLKMRKKSDFSSYCSLYLGYCSQMHIILFSLFRGCTKQHFLHISLQLGVLFLPSLLKRRGTGFSCTSNVTLSEVADIHALRCDLCLTWLKLNWLGGRDLLVTSLTMRNGKGERHPC